MKREIALGALGTLAVALLLAGAAAVRLSLGGGGPRAAEIETEAPDSSREAPPRSVVMPREELREAIRERGEVNRELREVEAEVARLKERVFRSEESRRLLWELAGEDDAWTSSVSLWHVDELGPDYRTESVRYVLDGRDLEFALGPSDGAEGTVVYEGALPPGMHTVQAHLLVSGVAADPYEFRVQSSHSFKAAEGAGSTLRAVAYRRGAPGPSFVERPAIRWETERVE